MADIGENKATWPTPGQLLSLQLQTDDLDACSINNLNNHNNKSNNNIRRSNNTNYIYSAMVIQTTLDIYVIRCKLF